MSSLFILIFSVFSLTTSCQEENPEKMTTYYFIRHAEKDTNDPQNKDPHLTEAGLERAQRWAEVFKKVKFDVIFFRRSINPINFFTFKFNFGK